MKKLFFLFALCLFGSAVFADNNGGGNNGGNDGGGDDDKETTRLEIQIRDVMIPAGPVILRTPMWYAEGWIDYTMNCIEVETNQLLGTASVVITDLSTGQAVASATIDPEFSTVAFLPLPAEGFYRMTIRCAEYLGESSFMIE